MFDSSCLSDIYNFVFNLVWKFHVIPFPSLLFKLWPWVHESWYNWANWLLTMSHDKQENDFSMEITIILQQQMRATRTYGPWSIHNANQFGFYKQQIMIWSAAFHSYICKTFAYWRYRQPVKVLNLEENVFHVFSL